MPFEMLELLVDGEMRLYVKIRVCSFSSVCLQASGGTPSACPRNLQLYSLVKPEGLYLLHVGVGRSSVSLRVLSFEVFL